VSSVALCAAVREQADGAATDNALAGQIVAAWNAGRQPPLVDVGMLQSVFEAKRDAVARFEVDYLTTQTSPPAARAHTWWTGWSQDSEQAERRTAAGPGIDPSQDPTAMRWVRKRGRVWFARLGETLEGVRERGASILGVEDSWLGAGGCIGDVGRGLARAAEHDLGRMLERLPFGVAVVESEPVEIDGVPCVVLRIGWNWPCWVYLDPMLDFGPRRIDRVLDIAGRPTLSRTDLTQPIRCGGVWLPTRIAWRQYPIAGPNFGPGDEPETKPDWVLESTASRLLVNGAEWLAEGANRP